MVLTLLPFLLFVASVSNILYLSLISILPSATISSTEVILLHGATLMLSFLFFRRYLTSFSVSAHGRDWLVLIPYFLILLVRFPLVYPTYDDLAAHLMWGDYANTLWQNNTFMPMNFLHYFYLPIDMNYTPFLYLAGIRLTIWFFYIVTSLWVFSLYLRLRLLLKTDMQKILLMILFIMLPFIPHLLAIIGTLMGDYISLIFCLEALYLFLRPGRDKTFAVLMMITAILMKQSNSVFIAPILLYYAVKYFRSVAWGWPILYSLIASVFFIRLYSETGNPVSGLFNGVFLSSLYSPTNFKQTLFGPESLWQLFIWPITGQFSERYAEGIVSFPAKLFFAAIPILGYCLSIWLMLKKRSLKYGLLVLTYLLWSHLVGYARYYIALNLMTLIILIHDGQRLTIKGKWFKLLRQYKYVLFVLIFLGSISSFKTDFSWRPNPSLATPGANAYYLREYREGLSCVGKDTLPNLAREYQSLFSGYSAVITMYRGPVTFISYMAYLNHLPVYDGVTAVQYETIMQDAKVSDAIKANLEASMSHQKVIILAEKPFDQSVSSLKIYQDFHCTNLGAASKDKYLQRESYFTQTIMFSCERP